MTRSCALLAVALLSLLGALAAGADEDRATFRIGSNFEPGTLDPTKAIGFAEARIDAEIYEGLVARDAAGRRIPGSAQSWEVSADRLTYTFHLRPGLKYSNGEPVVGADFVNMLRHWADPATASPSVAALAPIRNLLDIVRGKVKDMSQLGAEAPDERTVIIRLQRPSAVFLEYAAAIVPFRRADLASHGSNAPHAQTFIGNGPFALAVWAPNSHVELVRNRYYYDAQHVSLDRVDYVLVGNPTTSLRLFRNHELDIAEFPDRDLPDVERDLGAELRSEPMIATSFIAFNLDRPPFKGNLKLRQALALAIDPTTIVTRVLRTGQLPACDMMPPALHFSSSCEDRDRSLPDNERIRRARVLYAAAGYDARHPLTVHLLLPKDVGWDRWAQAAAIMWKSALGVETQLEFHESRVYISEVMHQQFSAAAADRGSELADAPVLDAFRSDSVSNIERFVNPAFDELIDHGDEAEGAEERMRAYERADQLLLDAQAVIPIFHHVAHRLVAQRVKGWVANPGDVHLSRFISLGPPKR